MPKPLSMVKLREQAIQVVTLAGGLSPGEATKELALLTEETPVTREEWLAANTRVVEGGFSKLLKTGLVSRTTQASVARQQALHSSDEKIQSWAKQFGAFLGRYELEPGPPVHRSATCEVHFAKDHDNKGRPVAVKKMRNFDELEREVRAGAWAA